MKKTSLLAFLSMTLFLLPSCMEVDITNLDPDEFTTDEPVTGGGGETGAISFSNDLVSRLSAECQPCHTSSNLGNLTITSHASVVGSIDDGSGDSRINISSAGSSFLLRYPSNEVNQGSGDSHVPANALSSSSDLYQDLLTWISEGAQDN